MKKVLFLLMLALAAYGQQTSVAVLPSEGEKIGNDGLEALTNEMREAALKVLPTNAFAVLSRDVVVKRLGGAENYIKECKESSCIVDLGKKAQVDYVARANVGKLGGKLRLNVELYDVHSDGLVGMLNDEAGDVRGLLGIVKKRVPAEVFGKIPEVSVSYDDSKPAQQPSNNFLERGILFAERGDYDMAIEDFTEALKLQPKNGAIYTLRGRAYVGKAEALKDELIERNRKDGKLTKDAIFKELTKPSPERVKVYDQAIKDFTRAIQLEPQNAVNYKERGDVYIEKNNDDKALADFSQAIKLDPYDVDAYKKRGITYNRKKDYSKAIADCNQAIRLNPNDADAYICRGSVYLGKGDYDKAYADYNQVLRLDPNNENANLLLEFVKIKMARSGTTSFSGSSNTTQQSYNNSNAYYNQGNYNSYYNQGKAYSNQDNYNTYLNQGHAYYNQGDYDRAIMNYNQAIKLNPNKVEAYINRGSAYYKKKEYDIAITDYNQVIKMNSYNVMAYKERGDAYYAKGVFDKANYDKAIEDYSQAVKLNPDDEIARQKLGEAKAAKSTKQSYNNSNTYYYQGNANKKGDNGNSNDAKVYYNQDNANKKDYNDKSKNADSYYNQGNDYYKKGLYDKAIADYSQAIKLDPNFVKAYYNRGVAYEKKNNYDKAIADYNQAIKLDPNHANAYYNRGNVHYNKGNYDRAIADYSQVIRLNPNDESAKQNLEEARRAKVAR